MAASCLLNAVLLSESLPGDLREVPLSIYPGHQPLSPAVALMRTAIALTRQPPADTSAIPAPTA